MIETEELIDFIFKHDITIEEFLFCWMLCEPVEKRGKYVKMYFDRNPIKEESLEKLTKLGFIDHFGVSNNYFALSNFMVTPKFSSELSVDSEDAFMEFFDTYPDSLLINNSQRVGAKSIGISEEKYLRALYYKIVGISKKKHEKMIKAVKAYSAENQGFATIGFEKFLVSKSYEKYLDVSVSSKPKGGFKDG